MIQINIANNPHTSDKTFVNGLMAARRRFSGPQEIDRSKVSVLKDKLDIANKRLSQIKK